jgi:precorrin-6A synthase
LTRTLPSPIASNIRTIFSPGLPNNVDDVVVMLDADCAFKNISEAAMDIYWGAYLGTQDEILVSGNLRALTEDIERMRTEAKARKGWIMDTYLLRRTDC